MDRQILIYLGVCLSVCAGFYYVVAGVVHLAAAQSSPWAL